MKLFLFIINPFISCINSLVNINKRNALTFLYFWFIIFGIGFVGEKNVFLDSSFYIESFYFYGNYSSFDYKESILEYFTFETNTKDIYTITVNFIVSRFTNNYHWIFFVYAIVFGFFYTRCLKYLLPFFSKTPYFYILLFLFCFSNPIFNINGVRFWTAAWIGVYALFKILLEKKYRYFALLAITPLVHGSFVFWIIVFLIALFVPKPTKIWTALYVFSFFISITSSVGSILGNISFAPQYLSHMIWNYVESNNRVNLDVVVGPLYARVLGELPKIMLSVLTIILIVKKKKLEKNENRKSLIAVYLVLVTIVNFAMSVPSLGVRFQKLTIPLLVFLWFYYFKKLKDINWILYFVPIAFSYKIFYWIRYMLSVTDLGLYLFPAPVTIVKYLFLS